jgi:proline dehydrogenase
MSLFDRLVSLTIPAVPKPIVRQFSKRYIAGVSEEEAFDVVRDLARQGAMSTMDILGEFITRPEEATANTEDYLRLLRRIDEEALEETNVSVKLSALGLLLDPRICLDNMRRILSQARDLGNFVRIDMEDSECTTATIEVYRALGEEYPDNVGLVLQSRLRRTLADLEALADSPLNYRLCKGIYLEPRKIAYTDPELIRRNFVLLLERMIDMGAYVGIATHDERLAFEALRLIGQKSLPGDSYEFQMLLGVDEELRRILIEGGHRLRVYVPFGEHWYPYSVRRLRENPQIAGHAFKAIFQRG